MVNSILYSSPKEKKDFPGSNFCSERIKLKLNKRFYIGFRFRRTNKCSLKNAILNNSEYKDGFELSYLLLFLFSRSFYLLSYISKHYKI